ncbi:uncharacterized protein E5676_scaffold313G00110 [Cucumis melo var. makuwa]|uniref:Uncharacterized protein n=1 Tax=Cucumis melo var. makuwa TaxID=1194695 RepID=A0A5A7TX51_CUCMM|nr:uncharacterized protein E6C27_scaffold498G001070 [Cucumis melo var. makuwa]TYK26454.1 uncharacterized protein E5676_scaffold313G00110 [Cucumis melo var. makuwa]
MYALGAHLYYRQFYELVFAIQAQSSPSIYVVNDWLPLPLSGVCQLNHADHTSGAVEAIEKVPLNLLPTINKFKLQVGVPVEGVSFESLDDLFYQKFPSCTSTFTCFNEMSNMLFWVALFIKLLELGWLVSIRHFAIVDPLCIWLEIQKRKFEQVHDIEF